MAALSTRCTSLESTIAECESSVFQLLDKLGALQTQTASIQAALAVRADVGTYVAGPFQDLERSLLSAEKDLHAVQAKRRILRAKESQLKIGKSLEGKAAVLRAELLGVQAELGDLPLQGDRGRGVLISYWRRATQLLLLRFQQLGTCRLLRWLAMLPLVTLRQ